MCENMYILLLGVLPWTCLLGGGVFFYNERIFLLFGIQKVEVEKIGSKCRFRCSVLVQEN